ncbi:ion transporter [uncultured Sanguibacteroides sp.]|uniref:ion transporter n=1 Tax=uncultured Sanguibacteroides sp. TaxID=1635151 RepID=UPI0025DCFA77|nr:ion transporter [uncultured Sanguibacteroides sp.]
MNRKKLFGIIEKDNQHNTLSRVYDLMMLVFILLSIVPLIFIEDFPIFRYIEIVTFVVFVSDYILRWITADYKLNYKGWSFLLYPFTPMAIVDLLSILPCLNAIGSSFKIFRISRLFKILRIFKFLRYSDKISMLMRVLRKEKSVLFSVLFIALFYIFLTALIMFNIEPHVNPVTGEPTFQSFFDALYWATVTLTTVGYGDLCPVTDIGRCVSMFSSLFGVAIIALPSGIITASYLDELRNGKK